MAAFSGDGLVKALLKLDMAINENAISDSSKRYKNQERRKTFVSTRVEYGRNMPP